jgi:ABC-type proline/glycine betaine transport system ATPase subunit
MLEKDLILGSFKLESQQILSQLDKQYHTKNRQIENLFQKTIDNIPQDILNKPIDEYLESYLKLVDFSCDENNSNVAAAAAAATNLEETNQADSSDLLEKEGQLLQQGMEDLDALKKWYTNQLNKNKVKKANLQKHKQQHMLDIEKMLVDLKRLKDYNASMKEFLSNNNSSS